MPSYERSLVLVDSILLQARSDYEIIRAKLADRAPDIEVLIVDDREGLAGLTTVLPTLVFSPAALTNFKPKRGKVYAGHSHTKMDEINRLRDGGIRTPDSVILGPTTRLDPETWGRLTVLKPTVGLRSVGVRLQRTRDVRWIDPFSWPRDHPLFGVPMMVQRFIDTGSLAQSHRVLAVLGRPIYSIVSRSTTPRSFDLVAASEFINEPIGSNSGGRTIELSFDDDVIACANESAALFPEAPVLGIDIVRQQVTGLLYVLEVNASGQGWHISSRYGRTLQRRHGIDYGSQFGALDMMADALIDVTRREAT